MDYSSGKQARRRSTRVRRTESAETSLTGPEKRRLMAYVEREHLSEAQLLRRLLLNFLDAHGVQDPGEPVDAEPASEQLAAA